MKNRMYTLLILFTVLLQSCDDVIPETDPRNPTFSLRITGDSFARTFTQEDDYSLFQLNLREDVEYTVVLVAGDFNGTNVIQWTLPTQDDIRFATDIDSPWTSRNITPDRREIQWRGNPLEPITGYILKNRFIPIGDGQFHFGFYVSDFVGGIGSSNVVSKVLSINIGDHETEVVPR